MGPFDTPNISKNSSNSRTVDLFKPLDVEEKNGRLQIKTPSEENVHIQLTES